MIDIISQPNGLTFSYSLGLDTSKTIGATPADSSRDQFSSLHQALSNRISPASVLKIDIYLGTVPYNPATPLVTANYQEIDLLALGLNYIRAIMLKCDKPFGYSLGSANSADRWFIVRTAFVDFNQRYVPAGSTGTLNAKYLAPRTIKLENPLDTTNKPINGSGGITVQMLAILA